MIMASFIVFGAGIANFAMHRAVMESRDPQVRQIIGPLANKIGTHTSYVFEFFLLVAALIMASRGGLGGPLWYGFYTILNAIMFRWLMRGTR